MEPKYNYKDRVEFKINKELKIGTIEIIDRYGTFFKPNIVSYDILVEEENTLYKHISENFVTRKI
jgi:hypothetical protein